MQNEGDIETDYGLVPPTSLFGPKFSFTPSSGHLMPDALQAIQVVQISYSTHMVHIVSTHMALSCHLKLLFYVKLFT